MSERIEEGKEEGMGRGGGGRGGEERVRGGQGDGRRGKSGREWEVDWQWNEEERGRGADWWEGGEKGG